MKGKSTIFLLLISIILVGGYFLARKRIPTSEEMTEKQKHVLDFKASEASGIEIKGADRDFLFERGKDRKWMMKRPLQVRASGSELDGILSSMEYLESRRRLTARQISDAKLTLADYGLEKPRVSATVSTPRGPVTLLIGNEARQGDNLYIKVQGRSDVYLVDKYLATRLDKKIDEYRERSLFDFSSDQVRDLEIKNAGQLMQFSRTNQSWRVIQPLTARADRNRVDDFVRQLAGLRADDFLSEDPATSREYGLEDPAQEVSVRLQQQDAVHVLVVGSRLKTDNKKVAVRVKGQNSIVSIASSFSSDAARPLNDFRDRQLTSFNPGDVEEIEIFHRQALLDVRKQDGQWKITQTEKMAADRELVERFLSGLGSCQIKEFTADVLTDLDKYGLKTPLARVVLKGKAPSGGAAVTNAPPAVCLDLAIGKTDAAKKLVYVKLSDESSIYGLDAAEAANLPKGVMDLRTRVLFEIKKDTVKSCTLKKGRSVFTLERSVDGKWKIGEGSQGVLDETAWLKFLNHLEHFEVSKIVGTALNSTAKQDGLGTPSATLLVTAEVDGKPVTQEILVGRETPQKTCYLLWKNQLLICEISSADQQILTTDWLIKPQAK